MPSAEACFPEPQSFGSQKRLYALIKATTASSSFSSVMCLRLTHAICLRSKPSRDRAVWDGPRLQP